MQLGRLVEAGAGICVVQGGDRSASSSLLWTPSFSHSPFHHETWSKASASGQGPWWVGSSTYQGRCWLSAEPGDLQREGCHRGLWTLLGLRGAGGHRKFYKNRIRPQVFLGGGQGDGDTRAPGSWGTRGQRRDWPESHRNCFAYSLPPGACQRELGVGRCGGHRSLAGGQRLRT